MNCSYSVVRYFFNEEAEEYVNLAVIVESKFGYEVRVPRVYGRLAAYSGKSAQELEAFSDQICESFQNRMQEPLGCAGSSPIERNFREFLGPIQLSEPRPADMDPAKLADILAERFLDLGRRPHEPAHRPEDRRAAISQGKAAWKQAIVDLQRVDDLSVVTDEVIPYELKGKVLFIRPDFSVKNGVLQLAGFGMSFNSADPSDIQREIDAISSQVEYSKKAKGIPVAVVAVGLEQAQLHRKELADRADIMIHEAGGALLRPEQAREYAVDRLGAFGFE